MDETAFVRGKNYTTYFEAYVMQILFLFSSAFVDFVNNYTTDFRIMILPISRYVEGQGSCGRLPSPRRLPQLP